MDITPYTFRREHRPRFGNRNPERIGYPFWEWMVRRGYAAWEARERVPGGPHDRVGAPIWSFQRHGATRTWLPDGRVVCVGGYHYEDLLDGSSHVYNDVVVLGPGDEVAIYGYPEAVFPPTHDHSATLWGERLLLVGSQQRGRRFPMPHTPVYLLDLRTMTIEPVRSHGVALGCFPDHDAWLDGEGGLVVQHSPDFLPRWRLDLATWEWTKAPDAEPPPAWRYWRVELTDDDPWLALFDEAEAWRARLREAVCQDLDRRSVAVRVDYQVVELALAGSLRANARSRALEAMRAALAAALGRPCLPREVSGPPTPSGDGWGGAVN